MEYTSKVMDLDDVKYVDKFESYQFHLVMQNDDRISLFKKEKDAIKVGDEIKYTLKGTEFDGWKNAKHVTGKPFQKSGGFKREAFEERAAGFAMSYAKDLVVASKVELEHMSKYADKMYDWLIKHKQ